MRMQEPESRQPLGRESLGYEAGYSDQQELQQEAFEREGAYQAQKITPQEGQSLRTRVFTILVIILSSLGFFLTVAGIVASAIVLKNAQGQQALLAAGVIGLVSAILVMLICIALFVIAVIILAMGSRRYRWAGWR